MIRFEPAEGENAEDQDHRNAKLDNGPHLCFGRIEEGSDPNGADRRAAEGHPLAVRQLYGTAADHGGIGDHKKNDAQQIA